MGEVIEGNWEKKPRGPRVETMLKLPGQDEVVFPARKAESTSNAWENKVAEIRDFFKDWLSKPETNLADFSVHQLSRLRHELRASLGEDIEPKLKEMILTSTENDWQLDAPRYYAAVQELYYQEDKRSA